MVIEIHADINKWDRTQLQTVTKVYYKVCQVLQNTSAIKKCDSLLLHSVSGITKCDSYYKVKHNTGSIVGRGVLTPNFRKTSLYCILPLFQMLSHQHPPPLPCCIQPLPSLLFHVSLAEWVITPHLMWYFN